MSKSPLALSTVLKMDIRHNHNVRQITHLIRLWFFPAFCPLKTKIIMRIDTGIQMKAMIPKSLLRVREPPDQRSFVLAESYLPTVADSGFPIEYEDGRLSPST